MRLLDQSLRGEHQRPVVVQVSVHSEITGFRVAAWARVHVGLPVADREFAFPVERPRPQSLPLGEDVLPAVAEVVDGVVHHGSRRNLNFLLFFEALIAVDDGQLAVAVLAELELPVLGVQLRRLVAAGAGHLQVGEVFGHHVQCPRPVRVTNHVAGLHLVLVLNLTGFTVPGPGFFAFSKW